MYLDEMSAMTVHSLQVKQTSRSDASLTPHSHPPVDNALLQAVQALPKMGSVKAANLIDKFGSECLDCISRAHKCVDCNREMESTDAHSYSIITVHIKC